MFKGLVPYLYKEDCLEHIKIIEVHDGKDLYMLTAVSGMQWALK